MSDGMHIGKIRTDMAKNYLLIALRNLLKNKVFSGINILGLAIGMAAFLLILQYVLFEHSYDEFHPKGDQVFRVKVDRYESGALKDRFAGVPSALGIAFKEEIPEVEGFSRFYSLDHQNLLVSHEADGTRKSFNESGIYLADADFLDMFSFPLVAGDISSALSEPNTVIVSKEVSDKYFESDDPLGKVISFSGNTGVMNLKVVGVIADLPENTHFDFSFLIATETYEAIAEGSTNSWGWSGYYTYLQMTPGFEKEELQLKMDAIIERNLGEQLKSRSLTWEMDLQPLEDIHLNSHLVAEFKANGDRLTVQALLAVAIIVLAIAYINYINLSTVRSVERAKEVGVRKSLGSGRAELISQFLVESVLIGLMALVIAFTITQLLSPYAERIVGKPIAINMWLEPVFLVGLLSVFITGSVLSGLYPAFIISAFRPLQALSGKVKTGTRGIWLRKSFVVFQIFISLGLIATTITVYRQVNYMMNVDLGMKVDDLLIINAPPGNIIDGSETTNAVNTFKTELLRQPEALAMTTSSAIPGKDISWFQSGYKRKGQTQEVTDYFYHIALDQDFMDVYDLELVAGRFYQEGDNPWSRGDIVLSERAVEMLGFDSPEDAIGEVVENRMFTVPLIVRGVVKDFHFKSLRNDYQPLVFVLSIWSNFYTIELNIPEGDFESKGEAVKQAVATVENSWKQSFPEAPFDYFFMDENFDAQYKADQQFGQIFGTFSMLAIVIAMMGLFGLSSYTIVQRTKEVGIRKVLGADHWIIVVLLSRSFIRLIVIAIVVASPLIWFGLNQWLSNYSFRIDLGWWVIALPAFMILAITAITIGVQTTKAAASNPIKALRYE